MITVTQSYKFTGSSGSSVVYYTMSSDDTCVSVTPSTGTAATGTTVEFTFVFEDTACFATNFTLTTYDDQCSTPVEYTFTIASPCSTLDVVVANVPGITNPFVFTATPSGGNPGYTVSWHYNTKLFNLISNSNSKLELILDSETLPATTEIKATVTDSKGCTNTDTYIYTFCQPAGHNDFVTLNCIPSQTVSGKTVFSAYGGFELTATTCAGTTNDWPTLELSYDTTKLLVINEAQYITIYGLLNNTSAGNYFIEYTVENSVGIRSAPKTIAVQVPACATTVNAVAVQSKTTKLVTGDTTGTKKYLDLEELIFNA